APIHLFVVFDPRQRPRIVRSDFSHPRADRERHLDDFVERRLVARGAKGACIFSLVYGLKRRARTQDATATGTEDVPRHIENAESRAVQKSSDHILFIELMLGGERRGIDAAKLTIWRVPD